MPSHFTHQKETNFDSWGPSPGSSGITYHLHDMTISYLLHNFLSVLLVSWNLGSWLISWSLMLDTVSTYPPCCIHCGHLCYTQLLPILLVSSIMVTRVTHSVYLSSLSRSLWSLMCRGCICTHHSRKYWHKLWNRSYRWPIHYHDLALIVTALLGCTWTTGS